MGRFSRPIPNSTGSSGNRVGDLVAARGVFPLFFRGGKTFLQHRKSVTMREWENSSVSKTSTSFRNSCRRPKCEVFSATPTPWSSRSAAVEKNALRGVRADLSHLLRSATSTYPRHLLRRPAGLPRALGTPGGLPAVRRREAGATGLVGGQSALRQAVRLLRREAVSRQRRPGRRRGVAP